MSMKDCLARGVAAGEIDPGRAQEASSLFDELEAEYQGRMGPGAAAAQAARDTSAVMQHRVALRRRQTLLQIRAAQQIRANMGGYRNAHGAADPGAAALAHLDFDELASFGNVIRRRKVLRGRFHARWEKGLATFRRTLLGRTRNKAALDNMVDELFGRDTGDLAAKEIAEAWADASEFARRKYNQAGGAIPRRSDWGLPQHHNPRAVRQAGFETWRRFVKDRLDLGKMIDESTGLPFTAQSIEPALKAAWETIRTDGLVKLRPGQLGGAMLANRRADHRFLVFRDGPAWREYNKRFGEGNVFSTMNAHLDSMARDIALMEILGPNPNATVRWLQDTVLRTAAIATDATDKSLNRARKQAAKLQELYGAVLGRNNAPIDATLARTFGDIRQVLTSAQLGSAAITAITDLGFQTIAARHAGIPATGVLRRVLGLLNPAAAGDRRLAVRLGLIAESWSQVASAQQRYVGEVTGSEIANRLSDWVLRVSGLEPWTQAGRWAFGMEFLGFLADNAGKSFDRLPAPLRRTMERYAIGAGSWDVMRSTGLYDHRGAQFLRPDDIAARTDLAPAPADQLATRLLEMVQTETEFAVPTSSVSGRIALTGDTKPGTLPGELLRSVLMYKNFAITLMSTHLRRAMLQRGALNKGRYAASLIVSTSVLGALSLQLKEMGKGRDPRPMTSPAFWGAAMLQGGGLGLFGDFLFTDVNRFDRGLAESLAGPVVGFGNDVRRLTLGNVAQLPGEEETNFGRELTGFIGRYTPGGSIWYSRLAFERLLLNELRELADPRAHRQQRRLERRYRRDYGQRYWWRPGERAPDRPPELSNIFEEPPP